MGSGFFSLLPELFLTLLQQPRPSKPLPAEHTLKTPLCFPPKQARFFVEITIVSLSLILESK